MRKYLKTLRQTASTLTQKNVQFFQLLIVTLFSNFWFAHCANDNFRAIEYGDVRAEGSISNDTVFDGTIKFYALNTNQLVQEGNYRDGILSGELKEYYSNGKVSAKQHFENGKINGWTYLYDSTGNLNAAQHYYYDIKMGPALEYSQGKLARYRFSSFDNELLFSLNYDSLNHSTILDQQEGYFFYRKRDYEIMESNSTKVGKEYMLYTPSPPLYGFQYSIVTLDSSNKVVSTDRILQSNSAFTFFNLSEGSEPKGLQLLIEDSSNNNVYTLVKALK